MARVLVPLPDRDFDVTEVAVPWKLLTEAGHDALQAWLKDPQTERSEIRELRSIQDFVDALILTMSQTNRLSSRAPEGRSLNSKASRA